MSKDTETILIIGGLALGGYLVLRAVNQGQRVANAASSIQRITDGVGNFVDDILGGFSGFFNGGSTSAGGVGGDLFNPEAYDRSYDEIAERNY